MDTKVQQEQAKSETRREMANAIRALSMDAVQKANSGHPGLPMGMADVASVLFADFLKFDNADPDWPDRDRFILSAGHGSMLLYSLLYLCGYEDMTIDQIRNFRQLGARTAGHPEYGYAQGIEMTTGPLGQGIATAVGMALAEKKLAAEFGDDIVDHYTYVLAGDGCLIIRAAVHHRNAARQHHKQARQSLRIGISGQLPIADSFFKPLIEPLLQGAKVSRDAFCDVATAAAFFKRGHGGKAPRRAIAQCKARRQRAGDTADRGADVRL